MEKNTARIQNKPKKYDKETIMNIVMFAGLLMIIIAGSLMLEEVLGARWFCKSIDGNYKIGLGTYYCNDKQIIHYAEGWGFEKDLSVFNKSNWNFSK